MLSNQSLIFEVSNSWLNSARQVLGSDAIGRNLMIKLHALSTTMVLHMFGEHGGRLIIYLGAATGQLGHHLKAM